MSIRVGAYSPGLKDGELFEGNLTQWFQAQGWPPQAWPDNSILIPGTGNTYKLEETKLIFSDYMNIALPDMLVGETNPESSEGSLTASDIAYQKAHEGIISTYNQLSVDMKELEERRTVVVTQDSWMMCNPRIGEHTIWDDIREHNDLVLRQAFANSAGFPAARAKELTLALGEKEFLRRLKIASRDLGIDDTRTIISTIWVGPLVPDTDLPLPENGIIIQTDEIQTRRFQNLDYASANLYVADFDQVDEVLKYGKTVEQLRKEGSSFITEESAIARGFQEFRAAYNIFPLKKLSLKKHFFSLMPASIPLASNLELGRDPVRFVNGSRRIAGHQRAGYYGDLDNLTKVEQSVYHSYGTLIENPRGQPSGESNLSLDDIYLLRKLESILFFSHHFSLNQFPAFHGSGRPLAVEKEFYDECLKPWLDEYYALKIAGDPSLYVIVYEDEGHLRDQIAERGFDPYKFNTDNDYDPADYNLLNEEALKEAYGLQPDEDFGFTVGLYGSASTKNYDALDDAYNLTMALASDNDGINFSSGGGTEGVMGSCMRALVDTREAGWKEFKKFATRARIVSNREGKRKKFADQFGIYEGHPNFFIREVQHLAPRQHDVMAPCSLQIAFTGGSGTVDEISMALLHNFRYRFFGDGFFKGFSTNNNSMPVFLINTPINGRPIYNPLVSIFSDREKKLLNLHVFSGPDRIMDAYHASQPYKDGLVRQKDQKPQLVLS